MFTGIIEAVAVIKEVNKRGLIVGRPESFDDIRIGSSICVSGACLSVVGLDSDTLQFDVVEETGDRTKLGLLNVGDKVNLERAMKVSDRFEGHIVQGHVEAVGIVMSDKWKIENGKLIITVPNGLLSYITTKGSIAIDGVSLTVASIEGNEVTVALIPHTLENTTLGLLNKGGKVNIETDVLVRHAKQILVAQK